MLRLVMTRTVDGGDVADAFDEALRPRMPRAGRAADSDSAAAAHARRRGYVDMDEVRRDADLVRSCRRLAMTLDGAERPPIESRALCRALFDAYLAVGFLTSVSQRLREISKGGTPVSVYVYR